MIGEAIHHKVLPDVFTTDRGDGAPKEDLKEGPKPSRRTVTPKGWAVGVPYSAAAARNWLRKGGVTQHSRRERRGTNMKWTSKRTCNPYVPPPTALPQPDDICNEEISDDTERKTATCPDLRTSTEEGTTSEEAHEERWTRTLRTHV